MRIVRSYFFLGGFQYIKQEERWMSKFTERDGSERHTHKTVTWGHNKTGNINIGSSEKKSFNKLTSNIETKKNTTKFKHKEQRKKRKKDGNYFKWKKRKTQSWRA